MAGVVLALAGAALLAGPVEGREEPPKPEHGSAFHTVRGVRDWTRALEVVSQALGEGPAGAGDPSGRLEGALCVVLDDLVAPAELLGDARGPLGALLDRSGPGLRLGVLRSGDPEVRAVQRPSTPGAGIDEAALGAAASSSGFARGSDDLLGEARRGVAWLAEQPGRRALLVLAERNAASGRGLEATIRLATASGVAVFVAGPEAPYATPPVAMLAAAELWRFRDGYESMPVHCDTRRPDLRLLSFCNLGAVFTWDARADMHWVPAEYLENWRKIENRKDADGPDLLRWSSSRCWPDDPPPSETLPLPPGERSVRLPFEECAGFPAVPSGFGYWHLTRLAAMTGGKYLVLSRRVSACPFRVRYDPRKLAAMTPAVLRDAPAPPGAAAFDEEIRRLVAAGILLDGSKPSFEGGVLTPEARHVGTLLRALLTSPGEVATDLRDCRRLAGELAESQRWLTAMRSAPAEAAGPEARRLLGAIDATRVLVARARFHVLAWSRVLGSMRPGIFEGGAWVTPAVPSRLCRFWDGFEKADAELRAKAARTADYGPEMTAALLDAFKVSREVAAEWEGTPVAAVALSGALWDYEPFVWATGEAGANTGAGPAGGGVGPGTPSSGGGGTGSGD